MEQHALILLVVAWTMVTVFIFTSIVTCLSLVGWVKFANASQQNKLFYALIIEVAASAAGYWSHLLNPSFSEAKSSVFQQSLYDYWNSFHMEAVQSVDKPIQFPSAYSYEFDNGTGSLRYDAKLKVFQETTRRLNFPAYYHYFRPVKVDGDYIYVFDDARNFALKLPSHSGPAFFSGKDWKNTTFTPFHNVTVIADGAK